MEKRVKVLYIAGLSRSGSTILGDTLGQIDGWFHVGEIRYIWDRGIIENRKCGCYSPFRDCSFWNDVLSRGFGGTDHIDPHEMFRLRESLRSRHISLYREDTLRAHVTRGMYRYLDALGKLYNSISMVTEARIIVDSSKFPSYAYLLDLLPEVDLFIVHLVRDPRAVAYSVAFRKKVNPATGGANLMARISPLRSSLLWGAWNYIIWSKWAERPSSYCLLRYEDFVRSPRKCIEKLIAFLGQTDVRLPFLQGHEVTLAPNHSVSGNPSRFETGTITLREDEEWRQRMPVLQKVLVTGLTMPWLEQYNYSVHS